MERPKQMNTVEDVDDFFTKDFGCRTIISTAARDTGFKGRDVDELVNDVYLACRARVSRKPIDESVSGWISTVARNMVIKRNKKAAAELKRYERYAYMTKNLAECTHEIFDGDDNSDLVRLAVYALDLDDRIALRRPSFGMTLKELADDSGFSIGKLHRRGKSAIEKLRELLKSPSRIMSTLIREGPVPHPLVLRQVAEARWGEFSNLWACMWNRDDDHIQVTLFDDRTDRCGHFTMKATHRPYWSLTSECLWQITDALVGQAPPPRDEFYQIRMFHVTAESELRERKASLLDRMATMRWITHEAVVTAGGVESPQPLLGTAVLSDLFYGPDCPFRCVKRRPPQYYPYTHRERLPVDVGSILESGGLRGEIPEDASWGALCERSLQRLRDFGEFALSLQHR